MNEWGVVGVIIALIGFVSAVVTPIIKLNTTIIKLTATVDQLAVTVNKVSSDLDTLTSRNADSHERLFKQLEEHKDTLNEHDKRITILEKEIDK